MDKRQLITILVTAVVTLTVRQILDWLGFLAKFVVASQSVRQTARKTFSKDNLSLALSVLLLLMASGGLVYDLHKPGMPTRMDTFWIDCDFLVTTLWAGFVFGQIAIRSVRSKPSKARDAVKMSARTEKQE